MPRILTSGFTVVELIVVVTVTMILAGVLFGPLDSIYTASTKGTAKIVQVQDAHNSLRSIQGLITQSTGFLATTYNSASSPNSVPDPSQSNTLAAQWSATSGGSVLITSNYATTVDTSSIDPNSTTANYLSLAQDSLCKTPLQNNYVYFVSGGSLYRRTLKNTTTSYNNSSGTCTATPIYQKQTCASSNITASYCAGTDAKIASNVTSFTVQYYASPEGSPTTDPTAATTVVLTLVLQTGAGNQISTSNSLRITHID